MLTKEKLIEHIKAMPEDKFDDIDILFERIVLMDKIERGIKDIEEGNTYAHEEAENVMNKWFQK